MKKRILVSSLLLFFFLFGLDLAVKIQVPNLKAAGPYYVKPTGNDGNTGLGTTDALAWRTIYKATTTAVAGETVNVMAGTYTDGDGSACLRTHASGTSGNPITFQNYGTDVVTLKNQFFGAYIAHNYITIKGLNFVNDNQSAGMENGICHWGGTEVNHIIIDGCTIRNTNVGDPSYGIRLEYAVDSVIKNCTIDHIGSPAQAPPAGGEGGNGIGINGGYRNLIENNTVDYCGHTCLFLMGYDNIVRNNTFIGTWGVGGEYLCYQDTSKHTLVENNIFRDTAYLEDGSWNNPTWQQEGSGTIFRRNRIYGGIGAGVQVYSNTNYNSKYNRFYHNVIYDCGDGGTYDSSPYEFSEDNDGTQSDNIIKNSIHYANHKNSHADYAGYAVVGDHTEANDTWNETNPLFVSAPSDFHLQSGSPCINAGGWLTTITSATGSGTSFVVNDARYFCDGFDISGVTGDVIQIQGQTETRTITDVNYSTNTITVSASVSWTQGNGVSEPYSAPAPDIGVYEFAETFSGSYYVDWTSGNDSNNGYSSETAWKTINKVNISTFAAGDSILFNKGNTWRETLTVPSSGSAGNVITFGAYGTGINPIISGANVITGWSFVSGTTYSKAMATEPRVVYYNGTRLANNPQLPGTQNVDLFNETFEGTGYSTSGWTENSTPDEDAATSLVGSPSGWGSQCLKIVSPDNTDINSKKTLAANQAITYTRFEFILMANTISELNDVNRLAQSWTAAYGIPWKVWVQRTALGTLQFLLFVNHDGTGAYYTSFCPCYMNRKYRIEVKWNFTNKLWGWRINGRTQSNNVDSSDPVTSEGTMTGSALDNVKMLSIGPTNGGANYKSCTLYFDEVAMSTSAWVGSPLSALDTNEWHWESNTLYVNVGEDPSTHSLEAGQRDYPFSITDKDYVTVNNIDLQLANHSVTYINNSSHLTFDGGDWKGGGFYGTQTPGNALTSYPTFTNLTIHGFGSSGINISADADYWDHITISHCTVYDNGWQFIHSATTTMEGNSAGIKVWGGYNYGAAGASDFITIEYNEIYNNYDQWGQLCGSGLWVDQWGDGAIVRYNKIHNNDNAGLVFENMVGGTGYYDLVYSNLNGILVYRDITTTTIYNNVCYGNERSGIGVGFAPSGTTVTNNLIKNNISTGNAHNLSATYGGENVGGGSGNVYTYNCFGPEAANFIEWGQGVYKATYDAWETAYGGSTYSAEADPKFITNGSDFHLQAGSPCIDKAVNVGLTSDYEGSLVPKGSAPDIGAYEKTIEILPEILVGIRPARLVELRVTRLPEIK